VLPHAPGWERAEFRFEALRRAAELGFAGSMSKDEFGGSGLRRVDATIIFGGARAACCRPPPIFGPQHGGVDDRLLRHARAKRARFLPKLMAMQPFRQLLSDRAGSGSDARRWPTRAVHDGDDYILNGTKAFYLRRWGQRHLCEMVRTGGQGQRHLLPCRREGRGRLSFGKQGEKLGWNTQPTAMVIFEDCRVPVANRLGAEGDGFKIAMMGSTAAVSTSRPARSGAAAPVSRRRATICSSAANSAGRSPISGLQFKLADMATELEAARLIVGVVQRASIVATRKRRCAARWPSACDRCRVSHLQRGVAAFRGLRLPERLPDRALSARRCACTRSSKVPTKSCA